jgi:hypothetical protein
VTAKRSISARRVLAVAAVLVTAATALVIVSRSGEHETPTTGDDSRPSVTFTTPAHRRITVTARATKPGTARWCTPSGCVPPTARPASNGSCGNGTSDGFHGAYIADCAAQEVAVVGLVASDGTVGQPGGLSGSHQVHYLTPPSHSDLYRRFYVLVARPTGVPIQATRDGQVIRRANARALEEIDLRIFGSLLREPPRRPRLPRE